MDYYISIAVSDTTIFSSYSYSHFRTYGSRWEDGVSNTDGWTIETLYFVERDQSSGYNSIRINDGNKFAEIRIYNNKISLIFKDKIDYLVDNYNSRILTIAGKESDIRIYLDRELVIDGDGLFLQESSSKLLEISSLDEDFAVSYKYLFYTVSGYFLPGYSNEYTNIKFYKFMEFNNSNIVALQNYYDSNYVFGVNPYNNNESSKVYLTTNKNTINSKTVSRTLFPINKINKSPDGNNFIFSHYNGATIFSGCYINNFDYESFFDLSSSVLPSVNGWNLIKDYSSDSSYLDNNGLNINTIG